jgi:hypothetical protein
METGFTEPLLFIGSLMILLLILLSVFHMPLVWRNENRRQFTLLLMMMVVVPVSNSLTALVQLQMGTVFADPYKGAVIAGILTGMVGLIVNGVIELARHRFLFAAVFAMLTLCLLAGVYFL